MRVACLITILGVAACGKDAAPPVASVVTIRATDFAFAAPDTIPAGVTTLRLINAGPSLHHAQLLKLDSGKTMQDLGVAMQNPNAPPPGWLKSVAGPNAVAPGDSSEIVVTLATGHYAIACFIPDSTGKPHIALGMIRPLEVKGGNGPMVQQVPMADVVVHLTDYAFSEPGPMHAGARTIEVINDGPQDHEMFMAKLDSGVTAQQLVDWVDHGMHGRPPARPIGGVSGMAPGMHAFIMANLTPGTYGIFCFIPDAKDHKEHTAHGMLKQITIS
ncbi:MAG TPA: hypothetical protein VGI92_03640 [Gemmatimonadales bacterium]|jgi:uncharacterized cupredoxin-like copper-binding protein